MRVLFVHPGPLLYSEIFLRLEPLGMERAAAAARDAGHDVRALDLQVFAWADLDRELADFRPEAVAFGLNYLANVPEVIDLAHRVKQALPGCYVFAGGHSVSFIAEHVLGQADGAIDAIVPGEGEVAVPPLLAACRYHGAREVPGVVTMDGSGPAPVMMPYPGTEIWHTESRQLTTRDYRLFDIQHAVLPTTLPLPEFYRELVQTQSVLARKHLGVSAAAGALHILGGRLLHGQTNFARMLWRFSRVYNADRQYADHHNPVRYELPVPAHHDVAPRDRRELFIHPRAAH